MLLYGVLSASILAAMLLLLSTTARLDEVLLFGYVAAASCAASVSLLLFWRFRVRPRLAAGRPAADLQYLENSFITLFVSTAAPAFAIAAMLETPMSPVAAPSSTALVALGISMGYMAFDLVWLLQHPELGTPIILGHHVLSLSGFPYAMLKHLCVPFVLFFILTEVTGLPQHARMMMLKLGREAAPLYILVGVGWTLSFFLVRILPTPFLLQQLVWAESSRRGWAEREVAPFDAWFAALTVPLPFVLNLYWFYLLVAGALKVLRKGSAKGGSGARMLI